MPYKGYSTRYQYRQAQARQQGWPSYWAQRQAVDSSRNMPPDVRERYFTTLKRGVRGMSQAQIRDTFKAGFGAMLGGDKSFARRYARRLRYRPENGLPPESLFYYH